MQRKIEFSTGEYYHLYNRGTDKRPTFMEPLDYGRFMALLYACNNTEAANISEHFRKCLTFSEIFELDRADTLVEIGAYCLMPNHFHILVREKSEDGIPKFMAKLSTGYTMYFNKKNKRTGSLFECTFKAKHADKDEYLKYLFAYIHLNPVKIIDPKWKENGISNRISAKEYLADYQYSSYEEYLGILRKEGKILNRTAFPEYFTDLQDFEGFVEYWLSFPEIDK
ncbi:MAG: transposase [Minisyncoccia bacterium]